MVIAVASAGVRRARVLAYAAPVLGLLLLAAVAQFIAAAVAPAVADRAAGVGGVVGAVLGLLAARRLARRPGAERPAARIVRITS